MRIILLVFLVFSPFIAFGQSSISYEQAAKSSDPKIISSFIVQNPTHPQIEVLKQRLNHIINKKEEDAQTATEIINHLIENDPNKAYVSIKNMSQCDITISFQGKNYYTLDILSQNEGRLLVEKGTYEISSKVCKANYKAQKEITNDYELVLNLSPQK